ATVAEQEAEAVWLARRAAELGRDDADALARAGHTLARLVGRPRSWGRLSRSSACAESKSGGGMALQRFHKSGARPTGFGDRAPRTRHAAEPARSLHAPYASCHCARSFVRRPLRRRVNLGGAGIAWAAEPCPRRTNRRGKQRASRADSKGAERDGARA